MTFRTERDPLGEFQVPLNAYYGVQTARALQNFPISGLTAPDSLVTATILVKRAAAEANSALGRLDARIADAIIAAADEILSGKLRDQFVVDVYQAGAGTSHNMNANEVLANRAAELLGGTRGAYDRGPSRTITSTWASRPTTSFRPPRGWRCSLEHGRARRRVHGAGAMRSQRKAKAVRRRAEGRAHTSAGRGADHARSGAWAVTRRASTQRDRRARSRRGRAAPSSISERPRSERASTPATTTRSLAIEALAEPHASAVRAGAQSLSRDAEHGRRRHLLGRVAAARRRARQDRQRPAAAVDGAARRARARCGCRPCSRDRRSCRAR